MSSSKIILTRDDITKMKVDVIVNAANSKLEGGGGVDGAIHEAAGPQLLEECKTLNGCDTGSAKITKAYNLPAKYVLHAVGPVWGGGNDNEAELLKSCYTTSLKKAMQYGCKSIAFPNISTGVYGFPKKEAATIATKTVEEFLEKYDDPFEVFFVCFDEDNYSLYNKILT